MEIKTASTGLVLLIQQFLQSLLKTKILFDKLKETAIAEGIGGEGLKMLLHHHAKRLGIERKSIYRWTKELEDSTSQNGTLSQIDDNNLLDRNENIKLICGDFLEESDKHVANDSVDLIFTDPQYDRTSLHYYKDLGLIAQRVLKPGGSLVTFIPQYALPEILDNLMQSGLNYWWIICVKHGGLHASMMQKGVFVDWKPLLWFVKGDKLQDEETQFMSDYIESEPPEKEYHKWAQSTVEAEYVISKLTSKKSLVYDPFLGGGTTALAALRLGRKFIGTELDEEQFNIAKSRLTQFLNDREMI